MSKAEMKPLTKKHAVIKSKLTHFDKYMSTIDTQAIGKNRVKILELEQRILNAETLLGSFDEIQCDIECLADKPEDHYKERQDFENKYYSIIAEAKSCFEKLITDNDANSVHSNKSVAHESVAREAVRLPQIELPKFNGSFEAWLEFRDIFESLIHNNPQIIEIQKFHYLRASLVGSAPQVIQSLEFNADNYIVAWTTLCDRFDNKQLLIHNHIRAIFNLESVVVASATKIRYLYEHLFKNLSSLKQLGEPTDHWDTLLIYIVSSKLDKNTTHEWEKYKSNLTSITLEVFKEFLKKRANLLETVEINFGPTDKSKQFNNKFINKRQDTSRGLLGNAEHAKTEYTYRCYNCKGDHTLFVCPDFLTLSNQDRINKIKALYLCINCLKRNHSVKECTWSGCKICGKKHNTLLHRSQINNNSTVAVNQESGSNADDFDSENNSPGTVCNLAAVSNSILSTAKVHARGVHNSVPVLTVRALLDCGSQSSFITSELCEQLKLNKTKVRLAVTGISEKISYANFKCDINVKSINSSYSFNLSCFVLDKITAPIPDVPVNIQNFDIPVNIQLADPEFYITQPVDMLIGADAFWELLSIGRINLGSPTPILQNTRLGWIVAGPITTPKSMTQCNLSVNTSNTSIENQLTKFWEVEEVENKKAWSAEEQFCENHFVENLSISENGQYIVSLPLKESPSKLGESRAVAISRFISLERRLMKNPSLRKLYTDFLMEYEELGHMTEISDNTSSNDPEYFMPHHGVLKESSTSTKLRVVFNASSPTSTGLSLNSLQMTGPTIQQDLLSIILRFRMRPIVLSSDIKMMYRQVLLNPEQRNLQKIVWRSNSDGPIKTYRLNTVTYGTTAASFLAKRSVFEIANECEKEYPIIANIIRNDMYVDDLLTSVDTLEEATYVCENISQLFLKHGFELRKWKSNKKNAICGLNTEKSTNVVEFSSGQESKILGLSWECDQDVLSYKIRLASSHHDIITKRTILSRIASIFDPIGLLSPCIILAKSLLQKLWSEKLTWDQPLPEHIRTAWLEFSSELDLLNDLKINRQVTCNNPTFIALHCFADASEASYGSCIYIVSTNLVGEQESNLLCAKSKVAPIKPLTVPRLELCAALVLSKLVTKVLESINIKVDDIYCWSDSTIVLGWIRTPPNSLKPFVANRVAEIQSMTSSFQWRHVPTADNPADIVSRGLNPKLLIRSRLWFHGPPWLLENPREWPSLPSIADIELPEQRKVYLGSQLISLHFPFERFSNLLRLKRTTAYIFRFIKRCRSKSKDTITPHLTVDELNEGFKRILIIAQQESFSDEYEALKKNKQLTSSSKILSLHPFLDPDGIIRVGGRLENSHYPYSKKHPIVLSPKHHLTKLILEYEHNKLLHAGPQLLLSSVRDTFWPIAGRSLCRKIVHDCVRCARYNSRNIQPIMGNLPEVRTRPSAPFSIVGIDYAGPFTMRDRRGRGCKPIKCWVALFVCFSTRAIHLEIVLSLSCADFLQAFYRFIGRRGKPSEVFSDNGTYFVKANKDLKDFGLFLKENSSNIIESASNLGIKWHFIPVNSPHFGGIWEAGVKSMKQHLKRVLCNHSLFFFDFQTLLIRIEAVLNSRPLFPLSSNPDDLSVLSPAHFLIGRATVSIPEPSIQNVKENRLSQYQLLQKLYEHFWNRWSREYINELQPRKRWNKSNGSLSVHQMVLVKDDQLPPSRWRMGRIIQLIKGRDGQFRVATIKTSEGIITRAVVRLCPLPVESEDFQGRGHVEATLQTPPVVTPMCIRSVPSITEVDG